VSEGHTIGDLSILHSSAPQNLEAIYSGMTRRGARTGTQSALACEELTDVPPRCRMEVGRLESIAEAFLWGQYSILGPLSVYCGIRHL